MMPIAKVQMPDGRIARFEVPEGTSPEQVVAFAEKMGTTQPGPVDFDAGKMLSNVPESGLNYLKNMISGLGQVIAHPVDTAKGVAGLIGSEAQIAGRNIQEAMTGEDLPEAPGEAPASAFNQFLADRYGSMDAIKQTAMDDPVGMLGDLSIPMGGAGAATRLPKVAKAGAYTEPVTAGLGALGKASGKMLQGSPEKLVGSAFKIPPTQKGRGKMIDTILDQKVMPSDKGVKKVQDRLDVLNDELTRIIAVAERDGVQVPTEPVYRALQELRRTKGGTRIDAEPDLLAIDEAMMRFMEVTEGRNKISPKEMLDFKRSVQEKVNWERKDITKPAINTQTNKNMSQSSRKALDEAIPDVTAVNKEMSDLLGLVGGKEVLQNAVGRIQNHNLLPWLTFTGGTAGGLAGDLTGAALGVGGAIVSSALIRAVSTPAAKARTAFFLKKLLEGDAKFINANRHTSEMKAALAMAGAYDKEDMEK